MKSALAVFAQQLDGDLVKHARDRAQKVRRDVDQLVEQLEAYAEG